MSRPMRMCGRCVENTAWGHSPLCFFCLGEVQLLVNGLGELVDSKQPSREQLYAARYRFRPVRCGKGACRSCPHYWYVYRTWRVKGRAIEQYLGPADELGESYEQPKLRAPLPAFGR